MKEKAQEEPQLSQLYLLDVLAKKEETEEERLEQTIIEPSDYLLTDSRYLLLLRQNTRYSWREARRSHG